MGVRLMNDLMQFLIFLLSGLAIFMVTRNEGWSRWGNIVGLTAQPLWFYSLWHTDPFPWGIFALALVFTFSYAQGVWYGFPIIKNLLRLFSTRKGRVIAKNLWKNIKIAREERLNQCTECNLTGPPFKLPCSTWTAIHKNCMYISNGNSKS